VQCVLDRWMWVFISLSLVFAISYAALLIKENTSRGPFYLHLSLGATRKVSYGDECKINPHLGRLLNEGQLTSSRRSLIGVLSTALWLSAISREFKILLGFLTRTIALFIIFLPVWADLLPDEFRRRRNWTTWCNRSITVRVFAQLYWVIWYYFLAQLSI
jgi:hypothetical protein